MCFVAIGAAAASGAAATTTALTTGTATAAGMTLADALLIDVGLASMGLNAVGQYQQSQYQSEMAKAQERQSRQAANDALQQGVFQAQSVRDRVRQSLGRQRAAMAAGGLNIGTGSAFALQGDTAELGAREIQNVRYKARMNYADLWQQAYQQAAQASQYRRAGLTQSFSTILGAGSKVGKEISPYLKQVKKSNSI